MDQQPGDVPEGADPDAQGELDPELIAQQEKELASMDQVSARQLIDLMKKLNADMDTDKVLITEYTQVLNWWVTTLRHLGSAIAVAFKDTR